MALDGLIFDLDGTLVDTNPLHVQAWRRAFEEREFRVPDDRILIEIGKGGDHVVESLVGAAADHEHGPALRKRQPVLFAEIADQRGVKVFPGAVELLSAARRSGLKTSLATGSGGAPLEAICRQTKIDWPLLVDAVVKAEDVKRSKPSPDPISAAAKALGLSAAQCAVIGDTSFDAQSCRDAGAVCLGVETGGHGSDELRAAGARKVWKDVAHLLAEFPAAMQLAAPGSTRLTSDVQHKLMQKALQAADAGLRAGEAPIGCVLTRGDGTVIASGFNSLNGTQDKTAHAEMVAFRSAAKSIPPDARDLILVSTLEPCVMCLGAAIAASVDTILYALPAPADSGTGRLAAPTSPDAYLPRIVGNILADESREKFQAFLSKPDVRPEQAEYVRQLLSLN